MDWNEPLRQADYEEPRCPLCAPKTVEPIPVRRVMEKLDEYLGRNDLAAAERHLNYWLAEAEAGGDLRGKLTVVNEQIGLYRKMDRGGESLSAAETAVSLAEALELTDSVTMGTTLVNAATAYRAFGRADAALPLYERAKTIYEASLPADDSRLAGLYNNMALTVMALGDYPRARDLFRQALTVLESVDGSQPEMAVTWCNLADLVAAEYGMVEGETRIGQCLENAMSLLDDDSQPHDGNYAFVCEKCAPTFGYYGYFLYEQMLEKRAGEIYERA